MVKCLEKEVHPHHQAVYQRNQYVSILPVIQFL